jgi:xanthine dehydrogenase YagR molybdenum-binding subunit
VAPSVSRKRIERLPREAGLQGAFLRKRWRTGSTRIIRQLTRAVTRSGAVFAEVAADARLAVVRVRRSLGVYDAGRITNPKLADSQAIGGMVGGIGAALLEHTVTDPRDGRIANADIPDLRAIYLDGEDREADPIGVKGLGEVVLVGVAPAVANAVSHATGRRVRELPITADALL